MRAIRDECRTTGAADGAPCWLSGQPIDWDVRDSSTDDSFEYDHYFPASTRPEHYDGPTTGARYTEAATETAGAANPRRLRRTRAWLRYRHVLKAGNIPA